jgi:hypothetical protein
MSHHPLLAALCRAIVDIQIGQVGLDTAHKCTLCYDRLKVDWSRPAPRPAQPTPFSSGPSRSSANRLRKAVARMKETRPAA